MTTSNACRSAFRRLFRLGAVTALLALAPLPVGAQNDFPVPCETCGDRERLPYPESGTWYNPDEPGTGMNLEVQNGTLVGYYYGYDDAGRPEWFQFSGALQPTSAPELLWTLDTEFTRFENGSCRGCDYVAPDAVATGVTVSLAFPQRELLRVRIGEEAEKTFVPHTFGTNTLDYFTEWTPWRLPRFGDTEVVRFVVYQLPRVFRYNEGPDIPVGLKMPPPARPELTPQPPPIFERVYEVRGPYRQPGETRLSYRFFDADTWPVGDAELTCDVDPVEAEPVCRFAFDADGEPVYRVNLADFGAGRFFGESENGLMLEGLRLGYD